MKKDSIGNRMKDNYEDRYRIKLTRRMPVIIRLDGRAFHTLTRKCAKPFDANFSTTMRIVAKSLCDQIQGAKCAYIQSDEISILLTDYDKLTTQGWFDYNLQKMISISAGIASAEFTRVWPECGQRGIFDSRAFNIPKEEVTNYFIWRQQDWIRNSVQMLAQAHYSHKQLHKKNQPDMHNMLHEKGINWVDLDDIWKNGTFIYKTDDGYNISYDIIFAKQRHIIEQFNMPLED